MQKTLGIAGSLVLASGLAATMPGARAQSPAGLCRTGQKVEYAKAGRRYPGRVEGDNGRNCLVYARAYMGVIDVAYADLRPDSAAPEEGRPDVVADGAPLTTTPREIVDAFARDPAVTKARLLNRRIQVTGSIFTIRPDSIWMKANLYQTAAVCMVEPDDRPALRTLREDVALTVEGTGSDYGNDAIRLQGCRVVRQGTGPVAGAVPAGPPPGRYFCRSAGRGIGYLTLSGGGYTVDGVSGAMRYDPATRQLGFATGSYAKWGWTGQWRTDPDGIGGPPEPRIVLTDGNGLKVTCTPQPPGSRR